MMTQAKKPASVAPTGSRTTGQWMIRESSGTKSSIWEVHGKAYPNGKPDSAGKLFRDEDTGEFLVRANTGAIDALKANGFTDHEINRLVVSKRSLERRQQKKEALSPAESDRAMRLSRIHDHAVRVFGSEEKANRWLRKPCRALDGAVPLDLLASETGAHIVESELHAIDHGMFA